MRTLSGGNSIMEAALMGVKIKPMVIYRPAIIQITQSIERSSVMKENQYEARANMVKPPSTT